MTFWGYVSYLLGGAFLLSILLIFLVAREERGPPKTKGAQPSAELKAELEAELDDFERRIKAIEKTLDSNGICE